VTLADSAATTLHVATYSVADTQLRVVRLPQLTQLERWCRANAESEALVGGFYLRKAAKGGTPLGELWIDGQAEKVVPFSAPWHQRRACLHVAGDGVRIARREDLPAQPGGDLLQAGPLLLRGGAIASNDDEGFSAGADQFDSDITAGRHPRAALGFDGSKLIAVACDGRSDDEAGLTISELAQCLAELGATDALNLDGGGSTSLVCDGRLANVPRESHGIEVLGGREIATALVFSRR
jgi:hypothetical protein